MKGFSILEKKLRLVIITGLNYALKVSRAARLVQHVFAYRAR